MPFVTEPISKQDVASGFRCGVHPLDDYFRRHALKNHENGLGRTFVLRAAPPRPRVVGFYTMSMSSLESTLASGVLKKRLPAYPCPVALVGRLAVHEDEHGNGHGCDLLVDAIGRVVEAAELVACRGIVVDAKDARALRFYVKFGFVALADEGWPRKMFAPIETLRAALPA